MSVFISYTLTGTGWSECTVVIDEQQATVTASYLSDALGDLLGAVVRIVEGESEATVSFAEEPGEYLWRFMRLKPDRLLVCILEFPGLWENGPDEKGEVVLAVECSLRTFAGAVLSASQQLLQECGIDGYRHQWGMHEFPIDSHERLRNLLDDQDPKEHK